MKIAWSAVDVERYTGGNLFLVDSDGEQVGEISEMLCRDGRVMVITVWNARRRHLGAWTYYTGVMSIELIAKPPEALHDGVLHSMIPCVGPVRILPKDHPDLVSIASVTLPPPERIETVNP